MALRSDVLLVVVHDGVGHFCDSRLHNSILAMLVPAEASHRFLEVSIYLLQHC